MSLGFWDQFTIMLFVFMVGIDLNIDSEVPT